MWMHCLTTVTQAQIIPSGQIFKNKLAAKKQDTEMYDLGLLSWTMHSTYYVTSWVQHSPWGGIWFRSVMCPLPSCLTTQCWFCVHNSLCLFKLTETSCTSGADANTVSTVAQNLLVVLFAAALMTLSRGVLTLRLATSGWFETNGQFVIFPTVFWLHSSSEPDSDTHSR